MATHIKDIIQKFLKEKSGGAKDLARIEKIVRDNLDSKLRKHVRLHNVDNKNRLVFYCASSSCGYEFNLKKGALLKAVKEEFPQIEDIKIEIE